MFQKIETELQTVTTPLQRGFQRIISKAKMLLNPAAQPPVDGTPCLDCSLLNKVP